jgi:hypothetical protein
MYRSMDNATYKAPQDTARGWACGCLLLVWDVRVTRLLSSMPVER